MEIKIAITIGVICLCLALALMVRRWLSAPSREVLRLAAIEMLWNERERIRGMLETRTVTHWEREQLNRRIAKINDDLRRLGVPKESL